MVRTQRDVSGYDLIGDIHGHATELKRLLSELGYQRERGVWRHPSRCAVFLGDLIDRGPQQREVIRVVRPMVDAGSALICLGNHELNAVGYATRSKDQSGYLRQHYAKNYLQHDAFLSEYLPHSEEYQELIKWFCDQPLWLELELTGGQRARVIHACWDQRAIDVVSPHLQPDDEGRLTLGERFDHELFTRGTELFESIELLLKGPEVRLPPGIVYTDKGGIKRKYTRVQWWRDAATWGEAAILGGETVDGLDFDRPIGEGELSPPYRDEIPVFIGHYWMNGRLQTLTERVACLDWSVAKGGRLVAYRWDGEQTLSDSKFISVWSV